MLSEILSLMQTGKTYSIQQLAEHLNTTTETVQSSIEYLEHLGYIHKVAVTNTCTKACENCHGCDMKELSQMPVMWEIRHS